MNEDDQHLFVPDPVGNGTGYNGRKYRIIEAVPIMVPFSTFVKPRAPSSLER
jgi:hypothetical protein